MDIVQQVVGEDGTHIDALLTYVDIAERHDKVEECLSQLLQLIVKDQSNPKARMLLARVLASHPFVSHLNRL